MQNLTLRERFLKLMHFEPVDRVPYWDFAWWTETLDRWYKEGLPKDIDPRDFFGMDRCLEESYVAGAKQGFIPAFEEVVLEEDADTQIVIDCTGTKLKRFKKKHGVSIPHYLEFPVKNRKDFNEIVKKLNPESPARYPRHWDDYKKSLKDRAYPLFLHCGGFFGWARSLMGIENLSIAFYEDKSLIVDMFDFKTDFTLKVIKKAVEELDIDAGFFWEDMAYNKGSLLSPKLFKELMTPRYKKITEFLHKHSIDINFLDCDGNIDELLPLWLEVGINGMFPCEVACGSDPVKYRKLYGKNVLLMGGINKIELAKGKKEIENEVSRVSDTIKSGGYIPFADHRVPPDVSLENYLYYLKLIKKECNFTV